MLTIGGGAKSRLMGSQSAACLATAEGVEIVSNETVDKPHGGVGDFVFHYCLPFRAKRSAG